MNCQTFEETLTELARRPANDLSHPLHSGALGHLKDCPECALRFQDGQALTHRLREMATEMNPLRASASLEDEVRMAFRQIVPQPLASPSRQVGRYRNWRRWTVAAAAVLLIVVGMVVARLRLGGQQAESALAETAKTESGQVQLSAIVSAGIVGQDINPRVNESFPVRRGTPRRRTLHAFKRPRNQSQPIIQEMTVTADNIESEITTQFIALSYGGSINAQEGGQLVRVELPRLAMLSMGLPVNMDRYSERVKADVLLGADGLAHAIRFVQ